MTKLKTFTNLKGLMCDQNNLKDQYVTNLKFKELMCDKNNTKYQYVTNHKLKGHMM